nr:A-kinase anchor protein 17B-like [Zootoca vivipara]
MNHTVVYDTSESMELCAFHRLYLKPVAKLTICVLLPEQTGSTHVSKWEVIEKLKNMVCPDRFTSVKLIKSTKGFILFEGEAETKRLVCSLKEKLHGKMIKVSCFKDDLQVVVMEPFSDLLTAQELEPTLNTRELPEEDLAEQRKDSPDCIHLEGLPRKWFAVKGSGSQSPSEDVLRAVFENFGKIKNVDIPMLDPYREEVVGGSMDNLTLRALLNLRTFEAFVQYQESTSISKAMETFKGMKLMFKGDDGKALACNIKVTPDTTDHFSESAIIQRNQEKLTLQELERARKREEDRGGKGIERKRRDDEEKKIGEGKRKRHGKRQIDWDFKPPRKQQKVTDEEDLWTEKMLNWEEKKYHITRKRVESTRLLSLLLNKVKDVVLASKQIGQPLLDLENKRDNYSSVSQIQNAPKEQVNCLGQKVSKNKRESKCQSAQLADAFIEEEEEEEEQYIPIKLPALPHPIQRNTLKRPVAGTITSYLTDVDPDSSHDSHLLVGCSPKASREGEFKKLKVYETDEFTHYLLNCYQTPKYARVFPRVHGPVDKSQWQRVVYSNENNLQINLKNKDRQCMTDLSCVPNTQEKSSRGRDNWEVIDEEPEVMPKSRACAMEFAKNYQVWCKYLSDQTEEGTPHGELPRPVLVNATHDRKPQAEDTEMMAMASCKPVGRVNKLKDVLEEISSDSESFSEALNESRKKKERKNGGRWKVWPFGEQRVREFLIRVQNVAYEDDTECSKRSFCSNSESAKHSKQKLMTTCKRTSSKVRREVQRVKWTSSDEERGAGRKKNREPAINSARAL